MFDGFWVILVGRSSKWPALRRKFLAFQPYCQACGRQEKLNVHHIIPVHVAPELELSWSNCITLCEWPTQNCHIIHGHGGRWRDYNTKVVEHTAEMLDLCQREFAATIRT